jgi:CheY-like chemotaxis protein
MRSMLVIDRSETIAKLFAEIFEKRGWDVDTCGDRGSAIERLAGSKPYDTVLLSYRVPGTTGAELVGLIRSLEHRRMTAVVMVTSIGETTEALAAGADEVLLWPVNPNALIFAVGKHVWQGRRRRENGNAH